MTGLNNKLTELKLDFMARELDRVIADAAARSLSPAATLEWLTELELEGRRSRSVERRFRLSKLQAKHGIESSQSRAARMEAGESSVCLDLLARTLLALGASSDSLTRLISLQAESHTKNSIQ